MDRSIDRGHVTKDCGYHIEKLSELTWVLSK